MKADIPDKILINRGEDGKLHHSYWTIDQELIPFEDTLYIRKDALIEKIDEILNAKPDGSLAVDIAAQALIDIRKVINSM